MMRHAIKTVRIHGRRVVLLVIEADADDLRRENFRWRRQVRQALERRIERFGITGVIGSAYRVFGGIKAAGIITGGPVRFILDAEPRQRNAVGLIRPDGVIPVLREIGVGETAIGDNERAAVSGLSVALQEC